MGESANTPNIYTRNKIFFNSSKAKRRNNIGYFRKRMKWVKTKYAFALGWAEKFEIQIWKDNKVEKTGCISNTNSHILFVTSIPSFVFSAGPPIIQKEHIFIQLEFWFWKHMNGLYWVITTTFYYTFFVSSLRACGFFGNFTREILSLDCSEGLRNQRTREFVEKARVLNVR